MRGKMLILLFLLCVALIAGIGAIELNQDLGRLQGELQAQELQLEVTNTLLDEARRLRAENEELRRRTVKVVYQK